MTSNCVNERLCQVDIFNAPTKKAAYSPNHLEAHISPASCGGFCASFSMFDTVSFYYTVAGMTVDSLHGFALN